MSKAECPFCEIDKDAHEPGCRWPELQAEAATEKANNARRSSTAFEGLERFYDADESDDPELMAEHVVDALSDLRHLCRRLDLDWDGCLRVALNHFDAETAAETACDSLSGEEAESLDD